MGRLVLFYLIAFGFTWAFWLTLALAETGRLTISEGLYTYLSGPTPAAWGPLFGAVVTSLVFDGWSGLKGLGARLIRFRFGWPWYLAAFALMPAIVGGASLYACLVGAVLPPSEAFVAPITIPIAFIWILFLGGPLQEEAGWRGTATDTLQRGPLGALGASIVAGILWGLWHLPLFFVPRQEIIYNQPIWGLIASTTLFAILLTWLYNNTGRSLFAVMLMHASFNWANHLFPTLQTDQGGLAYFVLLVSVTLAVVLRFGPERLTRHSLPG